MEENTEEIKDLQKALDPIAQLRGFVGLTPGRAVFVTPPVFREAYPNNLEKWPKFKIKPLDGMDFNAEIDDDSMYHWDFQLKQYVTNPGRFRVMRIRNCLLDWKDYVDADGKPIPCTHGPDGKITDDAIRALPGPLQVWLTHQINAAASVTPEESDGLKF